MFGARLKVCKRENSLKAGWRELVWIQDCATSAVDASNGVPLHSQLSAVLRDAIAEGTLTPGTHLPTELELQEKFKISRSVVRQSLAALAAEGLIRRGRGRGSVVAPPAEHHRHVQQISGLSSQISATGQKVSTEVLSIGRATDERAEIALGTPDLICLRRRRWSDGEILALTQTWLPHQIAGTLSAEELTDTSLHATLAKKLGIPIVAGRRQIRALIASDELASEMQVPTGSPVLLLEGTSLDDLGNPVEYFSTWHRADRVVFDLDVVGESTPSPDVLSNSTLAARIEELAREVRALTSLRS